MPINYQAASLTDKIDIGYGKAQVPQASAGSGNIAGDIRAARAQEEASKAAKRKAETPPKVEMGKLAPALQKVAGKDINAFYEWYKTEGATSDPSTIAQKQAELNQKLMGYTATSSQYYDKQKNYDRNKISFNEQQFRMLDDYNSLDGYVDKEGNYSTDDVLQDTQNWAGGFTQTESKDLMSRVKGLTGLAGYNADKDSFEVPDKDNPGMMKNVSRDNVSEQLAKDILNQDYRQMDAIHLANAQYKYDTLPDDEKNKYANAQEWYVGENKQFLMKDTTKMSRSGKADKPGKKSAWNNKKYNFALSSGRVSDIVEQEGDPKYLKKGINRRNATDFDEIRMKREQATENKPISLTNPDSGDKDIWGVPLALRRYKGYDKDTLEKEGEDLSNYVLDKETGKYRQKGWSSVVVLVKKPVMVDGVHKRAKTQEEADQYGVQIGDALFEGETTEEIRYDGAIKGDVAVAFGEFDPDKYMSDVHGEGIEEEPKKKRKGPSKYAAGSFTNKAGKALTYEEVSKAYSEEDIDKYIKAGLLTFK